MSFFDDLYANPAFWVILAACIWATAHILIAYLTIGRYAKRTKADYLKTIREDLLPEAEGRILSGVDAKLKEIKFEVPPYPEVPDVDDIVDAILDKLPPYPQVPSSFSIPPETMDAIAQRMSDRMQILFAGAKGNSERKAQSSWEKIIMNTSTGNPVLDGAIQFGDPDGAYRKKLARNLRKAGLDSLAKGEDDEEGADDQPEGKSHVWKSGEWI